MDNSMQNMVEMYLYETNTLIEQLDEILLEAEKAGNFSSDDINEIFRIMHTIKGSSAMMQFNSLSTLAHEVEDLFFYIRENDIQRGFGHDLFNLLFRASDFIKGQVEQIENNEPLDENIDELISSISQFLGTIKNGDTDTSEETVSEEKSVVLPVHVSPDCKYILKIFFDEECGMENLRSYMMVTSIQDVCGPFSYEPSSVESDPSTSAYILEHGFTLFFNTKDDLDAAVSIVKSALNIRTYEAIDAADLIREAEIQPEEIVDAPIAEPEAIIASDPVDALDDKSEAAKKKNNQNSHLSSGKQSLISVNLAKLDQLMALVGEIVITESMVTSSPDLQGFKLDNFTKSARQLRKLTDDLQDTVMSVRMVPVSSVFQKMNRIVRDMSQALGKPAKLITIGADTEVDKTIVDNIGDPIMHMVRNSMDHGLEKTAEERIALGKDPQGTIILEAQHTGSEVVITIRDDGQGVNLANVLAKAKTRGLLTKPENEYTAKEVHQLLLLPGFSTNEAVTEYSGRGVGMDVVKKNIDKVGGTISMASEEGEGTVTTLKIPLTLAIVDGMEISVGRSIFTIPIHDIRQSFKIAASEIVYDATGGEMIRKMDSFYPIVRLHEYFNIPTEVSNVSDGIMIWVESGDRSYCLFVDELLGEHQVVVKPLPPYLSTYNIKDSGIAGCTIMGDGNISIILDIANLHIAAMGGII